MAVGLRRPRPNPYAPQGPLGYGGQEIIPFIGQEDIPVPLGVGEVGQETQSPPQLIKPIDANESDFLSRAVGVSGGQQEEAQDYPSESAIARQLKMAQAMREQGAQGGEVNHPLQALGYATQQIVGAWQENKAAKQQEELEKRRRDALKGALGQGGDLNALADNLMNSPDPALVERGLELKLKLATAGRKANKPDFQDFIEGDTVVQKQFDEETGEWKEVGRGPRWKRGGGGQYDDADAIGGAPGNPRTGPFSDAAITMMADRALAGDPSAFANLSRANGGAQVRQLMERIVTRGRELGLSDDEIGLRLATAKGEYGAFAQGQRTSAQRGSQLLLATHAARGMAKVARDQSRKVSRGKFVPWNTIVNAIRSNTGDPNIKGFYASVNSFVNAYARAVTPVGAPTDAKMKHAWDMLNTAQSQEQFDAVMDVLDQEMQAELDAVSATRQQFTDDFTSYRQGGEAPAEGGVPGSTSPTDGDKKTVGGKTYVRRNGRWYPE